MGGYFFGISVDSADFYVPPLVFGTCVVSGLGWVLFRRRSRQQLVWACFPWAIVGGFAGLMTYGTYAQHFFRYTAPFAPALFAIGLVPVALLARKMERSVGWLRGSHFGSVLPLLVAGSTLITWPTARDAFVGSTRDIAGQHVVMARELRQLPRGSIIALTDAGALAYLGGHRTIDLIGLTTNRASNYYLSGAGSQMEFVESLPEDARPTHYVTYRGGWYYPSLRFGPSTAQASLRTTTIVGGANLELWPIEEVPFGIGAAERPLAYDVSGRRLLDALDVADYDEERAHRYVSPRSPEDNVLGALRPGEGDPLMEGGRRIATEETFHFRGQRGRALLLVGRLYAPGGGVLEVRVNGRASGTMEVARVPGWTEVGLTIDGSLVERDNEVVVRRREGTVTSYHWWAYAGS